MYKPKALTILYEKDKDIIIARPIRCKRQIIIFSMKQRYKSNIFIIFWKYILYQKDNLVLFVTCGTKIIKCNISN
jgi:hypothetical protein